MDSIRPRMELHQIVLRVDSRALTCQQCKEGRGADTTRGAPVLIDLYSEKALLTQQVRLVRKEKRHLKIKDLGDGKARQEKWRQEEDGEVKGRERKSESCFG